VRIRDAYVASISYRRCTFSPALTAYISRLAIESKARAIAMFTIESTYEYW